MVVLACFVWVKICRHKCSKSFLDMLQYPHPTPHPIFPKISMYLIVRKYFEVHYILNLHAYNTKKYVLNFCSSDTKLITLGKVPNIAEWRREEERKGKGRKKGIISFIKVLMDYNNPTSNSFGKDSKMFVFALFAVYSSLLPFYVKLEQINVNKWPKWTTEYLTRDWPPVG